MLIYSVDSLYFADVYRVVNRNIVGPYYMHWSGTYKGAYKKTTIVRKCNDYGNESRYKDLFSKEKYETKIEKIILDSSDYLKNIKPLNFVTQQYHITKFEARMLLEEYIEEQNKIDDFYMFMIEATKNMSDEEKIRVLKVIKEVIGKEKYEKQEENIKANIRTRK